MSSSRQRVLVYGNCQAGWLAKALGSHASVAPQFEIVYLPSFGEIPLDHPAKQAGFVSGCSVIIWQTAAGFKPPEFLESAPADCIQIRFPTLWLKLLWPLNAGDPRNQPETGFPYGRYPYGDRLVLKLMEEGVALDDIPKRYVDTDINRIVNLDRFAEMTWAELRLNDKSADVAIAPFIERNVRDRKLFGTINHPTFEVMGRVYHAVLAMLLGQPVPENPPPLENGPDVFGEIEIPLHPQVVRHFQLTWSRPGMRWRYNSAFLTLEEFLVSYVSFTAIPIGNPPPLWIARGEQAAALGNLAEAQRILIDATRHFPQLAEIWFHLGRIMTDRGHLVEAEKILRYALMQHPAVPRLMCDLAVVMLRRRFPEEAARLANQVLQADPQSKEARRILHYATPLIRGAQSSASARTAR